MFTQTGNRAGRKRPYDKIAQIVGTTFSDVATGGTVIPFDNSIPQSGEGNEYMTQLITPKNAASTLRIDVIAFVAVSAVTRLITAALFQDSGVNAIAASATAAVSVASLTSVISFTHLMIAGTISPTTFRVNIGPNSAATVTFNGSGGLRLFGLIPKSSIIITEILP